MKRKSKSIPMAAVTVTAPQKAQFTASALVRVLEAAYLGGAIEEFVLNVKDGIGVVAAVDKTACVFARVIAPVGEVPNAALGLKEVGFFIKAVGAAGTEKIDYDVEDNRWFKIKMQGTGDIKILLTAPDMIPTAINDYSAPEKGMRAAAPVRLALKKEACEKFLYFQDLVKNTTTMAIITNGELTLGSGRFETRTFHVQMGAVEGDEEDFQVVVFGDFLKAIFNVLDWSEGAPQPTMFLGGPTAPVLIEQGEERFWSLSPSSEGSGGE